MIYLLFASVLGIIPAAIAQQKGRNFLIWWLYGTLIWIVALPHSILLRKDQGLIDARALRDGGKKCPQCAEVVRRDARVCRFCGSDLSASSAQETANVGTLPTTGIKAAALPGNGGTPPAKIGLLPMLGIGGLLLLYVGWIVSVFVSPTTNSTAPRAANLLEQERLETDTPVRCSTLGGARAVKFVLCELGSTEADWRAGGLAACEKRNACNAWIWEDERHAARSAPMTDAQVNAATAVWVNSTHQLNVCRTRGC